MKLTICPVRPFNLGFRNANDVLVHIQSRTFLQLILFFFSFCGVILMIIFVFKRFCAFLGDPLILRLVCR